MTFDHDHYLETNQSDFLLFVYGTLRHDSVPSNCGLIEQQGGVLVATGCTALGRLHNLGGYPALVLDELAGEVRGEVWRVPLAATRDLDRHEGPQYRRADVLVHIGNGKPFGAEAYVAAINVTAFPTIPSGDWRRP